MQIVDNTARTRGFQAMVPMRDGARLNTFVFLPGTGGPSWPVILHRTPSISVKSVTPLPPVTGSRFT